LTKTRLSGEAWKGNKVYQKDILSKNGLGRVKERGPPEGFNTHSVRKLGNRGKLIAEGESGAWET